MALKKTNALITNSDEQKDKFDMELAERIGATHRPPPRPNARGIVGQGSYCPTIHGKVNWKEFFENGS